MKIFKRKTIQFLLKIIIIGLKDLIIEFKQEYKILKLSYF